MMLPIKILRQQRKLSQAKLAQLAKTTTDRISIWERSHQTPRLELQINLARAFKMPLHDLQKQCQWPETPDLVIVGLEGGQA